MKSQMGSAGDEEDFDEGDDEDITLTDSMHRIIIDESEDETPKDFPDIQVMSVEEVLKSIDERQKKTESAPETEETEMEEIALEPAEQEGDPVAEAEPAAETEPVADDVVEEDAAEEAVEAEAEAAEETEMAETEEPAMETAEESAKTETVAEEATAEETEE